MPEARRCFLGICRTWIVASALLTTCFATTSLTAETAKKAASFGAVKPHSAPQAIVIGFLGGLVKKDAASHTEVQLAARLREDFPESVFVDTYRNAKRKDALAKIVELLDADHSGKLSQHEKQNARIILYGHSWGASATVTLARELGNLGIPVLLTIQVDSVAKFGQKDDVISSNVAQALNYYQPDGILRGRQEIRAEDPAKTQILGNFRLDYKKHPISCEGYPWHEKIFAKTHMEIECDPLLWNSIETLIRSKVAQQAQVQEPALGSNEPR